MTLFIDNGGSSGGDDGSGNGKGGDGGGDFYISCLIYVLRLL